MATSEVPNVIIVDFDANTEVVRPMNADELKQRDLVLKENAKNDKAAKAKADARTSALSKLADLGLTAEEIAAL
jgi:hypothetical protein